MWYWCSTLSSYHGCMLILCTRNTGEGWNVGIDFGLSIVIERFSIKCRENKTKVIYSCKSHVGCHKQQNAWNRGKHREKTCEQMTIGFWFYFSSLEKVVRVLSTNHSKRKLLSTFRHLLLKIYYSINLFLAVSQYPLGWKLFTNWTSSVKLWSSFGSRSLCGGSSGP